MQWQILRLTEKTGGDAYAATARPVEERLKHLFPKLTESSRPTVVWFQDLEDEKIITRIEGSIFQNENIGLALKRFNCFKLDVQGIPNGDLKKKYMRQVGFHFFDPKGDPIGRPLVGKRSASLSGFSAAVERAWGQVFTMKLKTYQKKMKKILDGFDRVDSKKQVLDKQLERLEKRPNPAKKKQIEKELAALKEMQKQVEADEKAIFEECALKPEYLAESANAE